MADTPVKVEGAAEFISIGEAAERMGLTQRTLRYWEELGLLKPPARVSGGQRLYGREDLERLEQIIRLKKLLGFSLSEIRAAVEAEEAKQQLCRDYKRERSPRRRLKQLQESAEITARQIEAMDEKISQMRAMRAKMARDLQALQERIAQIQEETQVKA